MTSPLLAPQLLRVRWAAFGAAIAVVLGSGGLAVAHAVSPSPAAMFHTLTPARVFDTRTGSGGVTAAPIPANGEIDVTVGGTNGVPIDATGVVLNVTVVNGTAASFLTVWPTGEVRPTVSSLNWSGPAATPNAVTAGLGTAGRISIYNSAGTVDVLADVVGYYALPTAAVGTNVAPASNSNPNCILGQIALTAAQTATAGGAPANGQILPINTNQALFSLIGTTYGGNGTTTFALPDLRGKAPDHMTYSICVVGIFPIAS